MMISEHDSITLMQQSADGEIVENLYHHNFINHEGRDQALELLYPHRQWGYWTANILMVLGYTFISMGLLYFLVSHWENMSLTYQLVAIDAALICSLAGAWTFSLSTLPGKLFLSFACVLVGIFLMELSMIPLFQSDAYLLFGVWSLMIFPWVCISQFPLLWLLWSLLIQWTAFLYLYNSPTLFYLSVVLVNTVLLCLREYFYNQKVRWLQDRWHRIILTFSLILLSLVPIEDIIMGAQWQMPLVVCTVVAMGIHLGLWGRYRLIKFDMVVFSFTVLSECLVLCMLFKMLAPFSSESQKSWIFMVLIILIIFTIGGYILKKSAVYLLNKESTE